MFLLKFLHRIYERLFVDDLGVLGYCIVCVIRQAFISVLLINFVAHPVLVWLHENTTLSNTAIFTLVPTGAHLGIYYSWLLFSYIVDRFDLLPECRITEPGERPTPSRERLLVTVTERLLIIHWVIQPLSTFLIYDYFATQNSKLDPPHAPLKDSYVWQFLEFVRLILVNELATYLIHRLTHTEWGFKRIHFMHHRFLKCEVRGGEEAHAIEHFIGTQMVVLLFCTISTSNVATFTVWVSLKSEETCQLHSSLDLNSTFLGRLGLLQGWRSRYHHQHHTLGKKPRNLGTLMLCDYLFGTMPEFLELEKKRLQGKTARSSASFRFRHRDISTSRGREDSTTR